MTRRKPEEHFVRYHFQGEEKETEILPTWEAARTRADKIDFGTDYTYIEIVPAEWHSSRLAAVAEAVRLRQEAPHDVEAEVAEPLDKGVPEVRLPLRDASERARDVLTYSGREDSSLRDHQYRPQALDWALRLAAIKTRVPLRTEPVTVAEVVADAEVLLDFLKARTS